MQVSMCFNKYVCQKLFVKKKHQVRTILDLIKSSSSKNKFHVIRKIEIIYLACSRYQNVALGV